MRNTLFSLVALLGVGCTESPTKEPTQEVEGTIAVDEVSATRIAGSYVRGDETLAFDAREVATNLIAVTLTLHGMTIDATLDTRDGNRMWSQDAFASDSGADTTIALEDIEVLGAFVSAIEAEDIGISQGDGLAFHFGSVINLWGQWIPAMDPARIKFEDRNRAIDMCWWASAPGRYHDYDGHDCSSCSGDPVQGHGMSGCSAYVAYGPYDGTGGTWYWNGSWVWGDDMAGHGNYSYQTGDCYGRHGAGCGGGNAYFQENASHDHCVRNGHWTTSSWCSDELWDVTSAYNCF